MEHSYNNSTSNALKIDQANWDSADKLIKKSLDFRKTLVKTLSRLGEVLYQHQISIAFCQEFFLPNQAPYMSKKFEPKIAVPVIIVPVVFRILYETAEQNSRYAQNEVILTTMDMNVLIAE